MFCSRILHGGHGAARLPVVLLGGGGGQLQGGRVLDCLDNPNRRMCSLYLSLLNKYGFPLDNFGDSFIRHEHYRSEQPVDFGDTWILAPREGAFIG